MAIIRLDDRRRAARMAAPGLAVSLKPLSTILPQHDQVVDRAAALRHARGGDRGHGDDMKKSGKLAFRVDPATSRSLTTLALVVRTRRA
jgi:hypothetical protein